MIDQSIFRPYNIRGTYPDQLNEGLARKIAQGFVHVLKPKKLVLGRDVRLSSPPLHKVVMETLLDDGMDVTDVGTVGTDQLYFSIGKFGFDAGIMVSASHNPPEWTGFKSSKKNVVPTSAEEMVAVKEFVVSGQTLPRSKRRGKLTRLSILEPYLKHVLSYVDPKKLKPMRILVNGNFGTVGPIMKEIARLVPFEMIPLNVESDGRFPKGTPDPLLFENRAETTKLVKKERADFAVAWDSDGDRCFFHDENGEFIRGAFITALLAEWILRGKKGKVVSEPRVIWPVKETVEKAGGTLVLSAPGTVFIRQKMIEVDAVFGGENSAHYFYPSNWYAENGIVPFLTIWQMLSETGKKLSEIAEPLREKYFVSEEVNFAPPTIGQGRKILVAAEEKYKDGAIDHVSGVSVSFARWRFNLRASDNEPLIRLNVEARGQKLLDEKTAELTEFVKGLV